MKCGRLIDAFLIILICVTTVGAYFIPSNISPDASEAAFCHILMNLYQGL